MSIKSLLVFITIAAASLQASYADGFAVQDSVKTVYVKVIATEKISGEDEVVVAEPVETKLHANKKRKPGAAKRANTSISKKVAIKTQPQPLSVNQDEDNSTVSIIIKKVAKPTTPAKATLSPPSQQTDRTDDQKNALVVSDSEKPSVTDTKSILQTSKTYLWVGTVLVVIGMILGILFGKTALLVSIAGIVFVIIGYSIKT